MRVFNNPGAFSVFKYYERASVSLQESMKRLSSGLRILQPSDDPAGLAISEKFRAQIKGSAAARSNIDNTVGFLKTADGWMQNAHDILGRLEELAAAVTDPTKSVEDVENLEIEFLALKSELSSIISGSQNDITDNDTLYTVPSVITTDPGVSVANWKLVYNFDNVEWDVYARDPANYSAFLDAGLSVAADGASTVAVDLTGSAQGNLGNITVLGLAVASFDAALADGDTISFSVSDGSAAAGDANVTSVGFTPYGGGSPRAMYNGKAIFGGSSAAVQVGPDSGQTFDLGTIDLSGAVGTITGYTVLNSGNVNQALIDIPDAIAAVARIRATAGAQLSQLAYVRNGLLTYEENLTAAESLIRDVDIARETTQFSKFQILSQTSTAMLAQANALSQNVLTLLR